MDLTKLNFTQDIMNEEFEIIGNQYSINIIAKMIKTIPYEILTSLGKRYQRRYISR